MTQLFVGAAYLLMFVNIKVKVEKFIPTKVLGRNRITIEIIVLKLGIVTNKVITLRD